ncbi:MAG: hypothetical protein F6K28_38440 [Microcoleus sp. SIO2G3]|nr:hypothetical protein [Microcoleus sp. SIO2G3]
MTVVICPGVHSPELTTSFVQQIGSQIDDYLIVPPDIALPYSAPHVFHYLHRQFVVPRPSAAQTALASVPLLFVSFSAGVVGAIGAAWMWQALGRTVKAFVAFDGWGVPLIGNFPIHRVSHDRFTHYSSILWGGAAESFYADPPVSHLDLWQSPQTAAGWRVSGSARLLTAEATSRTPATAADFLLALLAKHHEVSSEKLTSNF